MDSLDKITEKILNSGREAAAKIDAESSAEREKLAKRISDGAASECSDILRTARRKAETDVEKAYSGAARESAVAVLTVKNEIIDSVVGKAVSELENLEDEQYFSVVLSLAEKYCTDGKAVMKFGKKDLARLPDGFEKTVNDRVRGKGAEVKISNEAAKINSGFILEYGKILWNCSFSSIAEEKSDLIRDKVHGILFP